MNFFNLWALRESKVELGEKLLGGDKSEAIFAARLLWGYFFAARQRFTSIGPLGKGFVCEGLSVTPAD